MGGLVGTTFATILICIGHPLPIQIRGCVSTDVRLLLTVALVAPRQRIWDAVQVSVC